jgi:hypothetical protein
MQSGSHRRTGKAAESMMMMMGFSLSLRISLILGDKRTYAVVGGQSPAFESSRETLQPNWFFSSFRLLS